MKTKHQRRQSMNMMFRTKSTNRVKR